LLWKFKISQSDFHKLKYNLRGSIFSFSVRSKYIVARTSSNFDMQSLIQNCTHAGLLVRKEKKKNLTRIL
jgi:hypothetical protein